MNLFTLKISSVNDFKIKVGWNSRDEISSVFVFCESCSFHIMRKKSGFTIVEQAIVVVPEFEKVVRKPQQQVALRGQSKSYLQNYIRRIALFVVHFAKLPEQIE